MKSVLVTPASPYSITIMEDKVHIYVSENGRQPTNIQRKCPLQ